MGQITYLNISGLTISTFLVPGITCNTKVLHEIYTCDHPLTPLNQYSCGGHAPCRCQPFWALTRVLLEALPARECLLCLTQAGPTPSAFSWQFHLEFQYLKSYFKKMRRQRHNLLSELKPVYLKASSHLVPHHTEPVRSSTQTTKTLTSSESLNSHRIITQCDSIFFVFPNF